MRYARSGIRRCGSATASVPRRRRPQKDPQRRRAGVFKHALERVFANKEAAEAFAAYYSDKLGPYWGFYFLDETDDIWWSSNTSGGADTEEPVERPDGTWVWGYTAEMANLVRVPKTITIVPKRDDPKTGEYSVPFQEEAITLTIETIKK